MKLYHYSILFAAIAIVYLTIRDISYTRVNQAIEEQTELDRALTAAADAAVLELLADSYGRIANHKQEALETFFHSLYVSLDCMNDKEVQQSLFGYFPFLAVIDEDGMYLFSYQVQKNTETRILTGTWSDRIPYRYETDKVIYEFTLSGKVQEYNKLTSETVSFEVMDESIKQQQTDTILGTVETVLMECVNQHNLLARQLGLSYEFHLPVADSSVTGRTISHPSFLFLFQGYPLADGYQQYERYALHASAVQKRSGYPVTKEGWKYLYHHPGCTCIKKADEGQEMMYYSTVQECAMAGAYPCQKCFPMEGWYDFLNNSYE